MRLSNPTYPFQRSIEFDQSVIYANIHQILLTELDECVTPFIIHRIHTFLLSMNISRMPFDEKSIK